MESCATVGHRGAARARGRAWRQAALVVALALTAAAAARADTWYEHYANAQAALAREDWETAVDQLQQAIGKRGDSGARTRTYGMKVTAYFPYLALGIAYYQQGKIDAALQAFATEERLGEVARSPADAAELQRYRKLAQEARQQAVSESAGRAAGIVASSLEEASRLADRGELDGAIRALGRGLAVAPQDAQLLGALERLQLRVAARQREDERRERAARLRDEGSHLLAAGRWGEAASALQQALALGPDAEASRLLATAQERLRQAVVAVPQADRGQQLQSGMAEARRRAAAGDAEGALTVLQAVLAVEPGRREALELQARLLAERAEAAAGAALSDLVASQLAEAQRAFAAGETDRAAALVNRLLALDPGNAAARELAREAYGRMNRALLGAAPRANLPPAISFVDGRGERPDGTRLQTVEAPDFQLAGLVLDESPVEIAFYADGQAVTGGVSRERRGEQVLTHFRLLRRLPAGTTRLRLVATDADGLSAASDYDVAYARPFTRSPGFLAVVLAACALPAGGLLVHRRMRRRRLLRRRFNPYIAGAPVLDADRFFGRDELLDRVVQTLPNNSVLLYGERRIGKTSFQHQLKRRLHAIDDPEYRFHPVFVDLQGVREEQFFATIAQEVFHELAPLLDGKGAPQRPSASAGYGYHELVRDLRAVIRALQARADAEGGSHRGGSHPAKRVKLVLQIDEVDELNDYDPRINQRLRSLFMKSFAESLVAVVSGVQIKKHWEREGSPWYNFFEEIEVRPLPGDAARQLVERPIAGVFDLEPGVADEVVALAGGRPYLVQKLCLALVNRLHEEGRRRITRDDVAALGPLVEDGSRPGTPLLASASSSAGLKGSKGLLA